MPSTQDDMIAELQRANVALNQRLDAALAQRNGDHDERIAHQSATVDVLKAMSASPGDPQPVFERIVRRAIELCDADGGSIMIVADGMLHMAQDQLSARRTEDTPERRAFFASWPRPVGLDTLTGRTVLGRRIIHVRDIEAESILAPAAHFAGARSRVCVPFLHAGETPGAILLTKAEAGGFSDSQIELLKTFAEQAVIAIVSAETYRALQERTADLRKSLEFQTATSDVLKVISHSTFDPRPALDTLLETAARLCEADFAIISNREDNGYRVAATFAASEEFSAFYQGLLIPANRGSITGRTAVEGRVVHFDDVTVDPEFTLTETMTLGGVRTGLGVPLLRDGVVTGVIGLARRRVEPFTGQQIELVRTFADQAVIAIENTRLLTEQQEALEQQTATAEVLRVINESPGNLTPVFDAILDRAIRVCESDLGTMHVFKDGAFHTLATRNVPPRWDEFLRVPMRPTPGIALERLVQGEDVVHVSDVRADPLYESAPLRRAFADLSGARTAVWVALRKDDQLLGVFIVYRQEVRPFSDKQIALLENFAAQAVIAMENARLLNEVRQRQEELRVTFENMGDGVAMFDETPRLVAWNSKFQEFFNVPDGLLAEHRTYAEYIRYLAERGDYGADANVEDTIRQITAMTGVRRTYERVRPDGRVIEIRNNPAPGGGFVLMFSDITERKRNEEAVRAARDAAEAALRELKVAQANLIQAEKMASLGQLTAGIAHEIKNPLNFVNNFAALSVDLLAELKETAAPGLAALTEAQRAEIDDVSAMLTSNLQKITEHGKRADSIVKNMLLHSRNGPSEHRPMDLNAIIKEALNLAYHGARAETPGFNITLRRDLDPKAGIVELYPQEFIRVVLNLIGNGLYAARKRAEQCADKQFEPTLTLTTRDLGAQVEIRVRDNGTGIGDVVREKIFEPFFTTKPAGEGTGLGLSLSYDIIVRQHGGQLTVDSQTDSFTEFTVTLPRTMPAGSGHRA